MLSVWGRRFCEQFSLFHFQVHVQAETTSCLFVSPFTESAVLLHEFPLKRCFCITSLGPQCQLPHCPPIDGACTLILIYEAKHTILWLAAERKRDKGFGDIKVYFSVAVQAGVGRLCSIWTQVPSTICYSVFYHHYSRLPVARGKGGKAGGAMFLQGNDMEVSTLAIISSHDHTWCKGCWGMESVAGQPARAPFL